MIKLKRGDLIKFNNQFDIISVIKYINKDRCVFKTADGTIYHIRTENITLVKSSEILSFKQYCKEMFKKYVCEDKQCVNWKVCSYDNFSDCTKNKYYSD